MGIGIVINFCRCRVRAVRLWLSQF